MKVIFRMYSSSQRYMRRTSPGPQIQRLTLCFQSLHFGKSILSIDVNENTVLAVLHRNEGRL